jgi:hypothetical protein
VTAHAPIDEPPVCGTYKLAVGKTPVTVPVVAE